MCIQIKQEVAFYFIELFLYYEKLVFKTSGRLLLVYSATFVKQKQQQQQKRGATF